MKSKYFRPAVEWIAFNDDPGSPDALNVDDVKGMVSVVLVADVFGVSPIEVAKMIVDIRSKARV